MFSDAFSQIRVIGRAVVLPSDKIKKTVSERILCVKGNIIDLGAGTQYWSRYLSMHYKTTVYAVDSYYEYSETTKIYDTRQVGGYCNIKIILSVLMNMQQTCFGHVMWYII